MGQTAGDRCGPERYGVLLSVRNDTGCHLSVGAETRDIGLRPSKNILL